MMDRTVSGGRTWRSARSTGTLWRTYCIARFTLQEAFSRRLILAGLVLSAGFVGLFALGYGFAYSKVLEAPGGASGRIAGAVAMETLTLLGLYAVYFLSSAFALFVSVGAISGEVDAGTLHAILARPIRRSEFVAGRWLAFAFLLAVYVAGMVGFLLLVARLISGFQAPDALHVMALMALGGVCLLSLSLLGSTLFSTLANGIVVFSLFGLAWMAGIIQFVGERLSNEAMLNLGTAVNLLVPSDAIWRGASYYAQSPMLLSASGGAIPFASTAPPPLPLLIWSLAYPIGLLALAAATFARRDI